MLQEISQFTKLLLATIQHKKIILIGHYDTDGITATAIMTQALKRLEAQFTTKIIKQLTEEEIYNIPKDKIVIFVDLGSGSLQKLALLKNEIFIIDHHELSQEKDFLSNRQIHLCNPHLTNQELLCSAELAYLVAREINLENKNFAHLAVLGMVGDVMEKNIHKIRNMIIQEAEINVKKGVLIYPSTRPLDKALEYSSRPFIPTITANRENIIVLLKEAGIEKIGNKYKALIDLTEAEMKKFATALMLRMPAQGADSLIGNLFLIKFFNKIEDARELSAMINACSRMDQSNIALLLCLGNSDARKKAERIYIKYRQHIISGLKYIQTSAKIEGREYIIINAKDKVKDTIIGTLASILSFSSLYQEGKIIIAMAYNKDKIKVSARIVGRPAISRNLKQFVESIVTSLEQKGEFGGHKHAAGCTITKTEEEKFIELIKKKLEFEMVKI